MRSSSFSESCFGSQRMPPLAPPYGRLTAAHLTVIQAESAITSSSVTSGW